MMPQTVESCIQEATNTDSYLTGSPVYVTLTRWLQLGLRAQGFQGFGLDEFGFRKVSTGSVGFIDERVLESKATTLF